MITHLVLFEFRHDATTTLIAEFSAALDEMRRALGERIVEYRHGPALDLRSPSADYGIAAVVRTEADLHHYLDHPDHVALTADFTERLFARRHAVQIGHGE